MDDSEDGLEDKMDIIDLGEVIATRKLHIVGDAEREITISIGKPRESPDHPGYYCSWQVEGIGTERVRYAAGVDAVQAVQLAMQMI